MAHRLLRYYLLVMLLMTPSVMLPIHESFSLANLKKQTQECITWCKKNRDTLEKRLACVIILPYFLTTLLGALYMECTAVGFSVLNYLSFYTHIASGALALGTLCNRFSSANKSLHWLLVCTYPCIAYCNIKSHLNRNLQAYAQCHQQGIGSCYELKVGLMLKGFHGITPSQHVKDETLYTVATSAQSATAKSQEITLLCHSGANPDVCLKKHKIHNDSECQSTMRTLQATNNDQIIRLIKGAQTK